MTDIRTYTTAEIARRWNSGPKASSAPGGSYVPESDHQQALQEAQARLEEVERAATSSSKPLEPPSLLLDL